MKSVLFIDDVCPRPYDAATLHSTSQGGTESTVTRIAEGLAERGWFTAVEQHNRIEARGRYWSRCDDPTSGLSAVVCLRDPNSLYRASKHFPGAKLYLWSHDLYSEQATEQVSKAVRETASSVVCVSNFHKLQIRRSGYLGPIQVSHPPIDPAIERQPDVYDPFQLVWFSSPHKGLKQALEIFAEIYKRDSRFKFVVHNPGYFEDHKTDQPGVIIKPPGNYFDSIESVRGSLCVFYPNMVFPETFGIVFAEAEALGTPVLTHDLGAAREVLDHPQEIMDCRNTEKVVERVLHWSRGNRPVVRVNPKFSLKKSLDSWEKILNE